MPIASGTRNELSPRKLPLSPEARRMWIAFADHIERRLGASGELAPVAGLANKLPEHAARIAAVLALIGDIDAGEVVAAEMEAGIEIAQHYAAEALRLWGASRVSAELRQAQHLLAWLHNVWQKPVVSLPDLYQRGPSAIRDKASAHSAVTKLETHGWLMPTAPCEIEGTFRHEVWRIIKG
jgi:hypothetical protein